MNLTYHLVPASFFNSLESSSEYFPQDFAYDGFIHCSDGEFAVSKIAYNIYRELTDELLILFIDKDRVLAEIKYEDPNHLFPHIYGGLNRDAIVKISKMEKDRRNDWIFPINQILPRASKDDGLLASTQHMSQTMKWIQELQSICQSGLTYSKDPYDRQRFEAVQNIAINMLANLTSFSVEKTKGIFFEDKGYRTPKVDVRGAVFDQNRILLVKERSDGLWTLPGGWADINDKPSYAVEREVLEETGLTVKATKLVAVHDINNHQPGQFYHAYKLLFLCLPTGGNLVSTSETSDFGYFDSTTLPPLSINRTSAGQIQLLFQHMLDPTQPTVFD